jgi:hypothetical protein
VCTCVRHIHAINHPRTGEARARTHRQTDTQMPHRRSPSPTRTLSLCCSQTKAWKARHKRACAPAARSGTRTAAKPTADQLRVLEILQQLAAAADWRGVAAQERVARAVAAAVRTSMPGYASFVYCTLGNAYDSLGDCSKAIEYHGQRLAIAKEVGDRAGEGMAYANLGTGHMYLNENDKAVAYFEAQHAMAISLKLARMQSDAALNMGVALTLHVRAARQGPTGADQAPGPHSHTSASACLDDRVREAAKWLQVAFDSGHKFAKLHLAHLTFDAGQEDAALAHLKEHLSWRVQRGRGTCAGCGQTRGEDTPMLTCSGCRVARFCSADHQKMASKKAALGGRLMTGRHKDICGVLSKWREVVKDGVPPDSCTADLVAFLQR